MIKMSQLEENQHYYILTASEYEKLMNCIGQYIDYDNELFCDDCRDKKYKLDDEVCGLDLWRADENNYSELKIGNTYIKDNVLTCIFNNAVHKYKIVNRKADKGDLALIIKPCLADGNTKGKFINHVFKVNGRTNNDGWTEECATVRINNIEYQGWCFYSIL